MRLAQMRLFLASRKKFAVYRIKYIRLHFLAMPFNLIADRRFVLIDTASDLCFAQPGIDTVLYSDPVRQRKLIIFTFHVITRLSSRNV